MLQFLRLIVTVSMYLFKGRLLLRYACVHLSGFQPKVRWCMAK